MVTGAPVWVQLVYLAAAVCFVLAAVNMVGGFVVTDRMLQMFTRKPLRRAQGPSGRGEA